MWSRYNYLFETGKREQYESRTYNDLLLSTHKVIVLHTDFEYAVRYLIIYFKYFLKSYFALMKTKYNTSQRVNYFVNFDQIK